MKAIGKWQVTAPMRSWFKTAIQKRHRQLADHLDRKTQHWNRASKVLFLLLICLLLGALSFGLLIRAIY
ncbi:hypothetical protein [Pedobacter jejuensis]|uniref:Uncharacterized protein n=1 Tax=Pedobacter jejuensis TaxID=1268550 RepID=A0A3N0C1H2_9SPHI|nr:hypothetical protein D7004_04540 [Pedobacter jejuensis]